MRETAKTDLYLRVLPLEVCYRNKNIYGIGGKKRNTKIQEDQAIVSAIICDELSFYIACVIAAAFIKTKSCPRCCDYIASIKQHLRSVILQRDCPSVLQSSADHSLTEPSSQTKRLLPQPISLHGDAVQEHRPQEEEQCRRPRLPIRRHRSLPDASVELAQEQPQGSAVGPMG